MDLLLWRWSTAVQVTSALLIAVFFLVLSRSVRRAETRPLGWAWLANLAALSVTVAFWFLQPSTHAGRAVLEFGYFFAKTVFVALLLLSGWRFSHPGGGRRAVPRLLAAAAAYALIASVVSTSIGTMGVIQASVLTGLCTAAAVLILRDRPPGSAWLAFGFSTRAALGAVEVVAYLALVRGGEVSRSVEVFLASHSSMDTGAEWVIALGCVLTLYQTMQKELLRTNRDLLASQEALRSLVDRDPLTGLANRRSLAGALRSAYDTGATILFFDLDDFKRVNDVHGHTAGDEVLVRFAGALESTFRPGDHVLRYGGDEFVVIAPDAEPGQVLPRVESLRRRLDGEAARPVAFTVGHAHLPVGGDPEEALRAADAAMYAGKSSGDGLVASGAGPAAIAGVLRPSDPRGRR